MQMSVHSRCIVASRFISAPAVRPDQGNVLIQSIQVSGRLADGHSHSRSKVIKSVFRLVVVPGARGRNSDAWVAQTLLEAEFR